MIYKFKTQFNTNKIIRIISTRINQQLFINIGLFSFLVLVAITITFYYVSNEHTFYFWDYVQYQDMATAKAIYFRELPLTPVSLIRALEGIWKSTAQDYSDFHTLLSIPFILIFGNSRFVYILSLVLLYILPLSLVLGAITAKLIPLYPRSVFWSTALLSLLTPAVWLPTLWGYPDTGSALLIALVILTYLQDFQLRNRWQILLIGFCLALAILFRRHFIYASISFFVCITLHALIVFYAKVKRSRKEALSSLIKRLIQIGWTVASTTFFLVVLGWPFIDRVLHTNFSLLYSSYEQPINVNFEYYRAYYGWLVCLLAVLGITAGVFNRVLARPVATFITLFSSFSIFQWLLKVKQLGFHYSLHFTPWVVVGFSAFFWTAWSRLEGKKRWIVLSSSLLLVFVNLFIGLAPLDRLLNPKLTHFNTATGLQELFIRNYPPQNRIDYNEIAQLVNYLRDISLPEEPIYVAASSGILSDDLLWHTDRTLNENVMSYSSQEFWRSNGLNILRWSPFADSRDPYPLERLLYSKYVVIATPFQYHLRREEQDVMAVVVEAFTKNWDFAQDFTRLPQQFTLDKGTQVSIYERVQPTSLETAVRTLKAMQNYIGERPGGQLSLLSLSKVPGYYIKKNRDDTFNIDFYSDEYQQTATSSFLYLDTPQSRATFTGKISNFDNHCNKLSLKLAAIDASGKEIDTKKIAPFTTDTPNFSVSVQTQNSVYLLLEISTKDQKNSTSSCSWNIRNLAVSAK